MRRVGVCSWSLQANGPEELVELLQAVGAPWTQLHLDPLRSGDWSEEKTLSQLMRANIGIASGMMSFEGEDYGTLESIRETGGVRPDDHWEKNLEAAEGNARLAERIGLDLVTLHAGFIPEAVNDPLRATMRDRLRTLIDLFAARGVRIGFETGQETASTLLEVLDEIDRPTLGINFDPANMILYGMGDPIDALRLCAPQIFQIHVKDANPTAVSGTWGEEVCAGTGSVDWPTFFDALRADEIEVDLMIEREAGDDRLGDIGRAHALVQKLL